MNSIWVVLAVFCLLPSSVYGETYLVLDLVNMRNGPIPMSEQEKTVWLNGSTLEEYERSVLDLNLVFEEDRWDVDDLTREILATSRNIVLQAALECKKQDPNLGISYGSIRVGLVHGIRKVQRRRLLAQLQNVVSYLQALREKIVQKKSSLKFLVPFDPNAQSDHYARAAQLLSGEGFPELPAQVQSEIIETLAEFDSYYAQAIRFNSRLSFLTRFGVFAGSAWSLWRADDFFALNNLRFHMFGGLGLATGVEFLTQKFLHKQPSAEVKPFMDAINQAVLSASLIKRDLKYKKTWAFESLKCIGKASDMRGEWLEIARENASLTEVETVKDVKSSHFFNPECLICAESMSVGQTVKYGTCKHGFHQDCIDRWHDWCEAEQFNRCPCCRQYWSQFERFSGKILEE